ncbi:MAG TPA: LysM peptidoglycan-binding domain-containing protein [Aggregatilineales bacterium]|nr:LysM peptidoglycan-binding domain-containing protein [Anaerolineales bacterium]HRE48773.1 LysM peptidoglycan-binding domain-containing protein [Aggregatilineales bacterium]
MPRTRQLAQICPICGAKIALEKPRCDQCGAYLRGLPEDTAKIVPLRRAEMGNSSKPPKSAYDMGDGETEGDFDLSEAALPRAPFPVVFLGMLTFGVVVGISAFLLWWFTRSQPTTGVALLPPSQLPAPAAVSATITLTPTPNTRFVTFTPAPVATFEIVSTSPGWVTPTAAGMTVLAAPPTNTRVALLPTSLLPTGAFFTVTPIPPSPTLTPTVGPCLEKARAGDTLSALAIRCGHKHMDVIPEILRLNDMKSAAELQIGQEIIIPRPTEIGSLTTDSSEDGLPPADSMGEVLPPGVMYYTVKKGENALEILIKLGITMGTLSNLNPEVLFAGCEFGMPSGGPECTVILYEGQRLRVPAPTPTPTLPPTLTGSETPTPTATATFNAPISQFPSENMLFEKYEFPTLRWSSTGRLAADEAYLITVINTTAGITYIMTTRDTSFQLPPNWQPLDGQRHRFTWQVGVARVQGTNAIPLPYQTEVRAFTWVSR